MSSDLDRPHEPERPAAAHRDQTADRAAGKIFDTIARAAATVCGTPITAVGIIDAGQIRLAGAHGPACGTLIDAIPQLFAAATNGVYVITDAAADGWPRGGNPLVHGEPRLRFCAAAPITSSRGQHRGVITAADQAPRQLTEAQTATLAHLADITAHLLDLRPATGHPTPVERDRCADQAAPELADRLRDAASAQRDATRPVACQLGGTTTPCSAAAEFKVADSWGDSAWGCTAHVEQALLTVRTAFLASEERDGLAGFLARP